LSNSPSSGLSSLLEEIGGVIVEPKDEFLKLLNRKTSLLKPLGVITLFHGVHGALIGTILFKAFLTFSYLWKLIWVGPQTLPLHLLIFFTPVTLAILSVALMVTTWILSSVITHLCVRIVFGKKGSYLKLLNLYGYASVPFFLSIVGLLMLSLTSKFFVYSIALLATSVLWSIIILITAVQSVYEVSAGKAFISSVIAPLFVILVLTAIGSVIL